MSPLTEDSVSRLKYEHGKHVRDMDRVERLSVPEDRQPTDGVERESITQRRRDSSESRHLPIGIH